MSPVAAASSSLRSGMEERMDETAWLNATDPQPLLEHLCRFRKATRLKSGRRKLRLFACACCQQLWPFLTDGRSQRAIEISEQYADGQASKDELAEAQSAADAARTVLGRFLTTADGEAPPASRAAWLASGAAVDVAASSLIEVLVNLVLSQTGLAVRAAANEGDSVSTVGLAALHELQRLQCGLLRDIFGPLPFRPVTLSPSVRTWNSGCVVKLATSIYQERDFSPERMGVLADALEEAGLTDEEVLGHCRGLPAVHCRGCWVVDLLTGRE
jgi:hypothetical protein